MKEIPRTLNTLESSEANRTIKILDHKLPHLGSDYPGTVLLITDSSKILRLYTKMEGTTLRQCLFLDRLPLEIRLEIFKYVLASRFNTYETNMKSEEVRRDLPSP